LNHVDSQARTKAAAHHRRTYHSDFPAWGAGDRAYADRHFPKHRYSVVSVIWTFNGLPPQELADRIVSITERNMTTVVDNIQHVESQSLYGIAVVKVFSNLASVLIGPSPRSRQVPNTTEAIAAGHNSTFDHYLQRVDGPDLATGTVR